MTGEKGEPGQDGQDGVLVNNALIATNNNTSLIAPLTYTYYI